MTKTFISLFVAVLLSLPHSVEAQTAKGVPDVQPSGVKMPVFTVENPDMTKSPYTGMTRKHWRQAAKYLLEGAFSYIHGLDDPMYFPKQLDKTYPQDAGAIAVAKLEGLCRTLFVAAPLLKDEPDLTVNGIRMADYYLHQLRNMQDKSSNGFVKNCPGSPTQTLLELGAMTLSIKAVPDLLWNPLTQTEKDNLAAMLKTYGEGPTIGSNWKFFNVFILSFLKDMGYKVNDAYLEKNLKDLLSYYRGEGWYNDAPAYDYYSMWAYQTYGPIWAWFYGKKQFPEIASQFMKNQHDMVANYPYMFARDGRMNMWGRSICYRFSAVSPLPFLEFDESGEVNYGWMRRIASATLLQFMRNPEFLKDGVPTMGFYGEFAPCVQIYSCRGSVYWCGKAFLGLYLPETSKYWSATENNGPWDNELKPGKVYNKFQPATNLLITDYPDCGGAEMRSWCHETVAKDWQKFRSSENYNKLAYNTEFPWMADGPDGEVSMNFATLNKKNNWEVLRLYTFKSFKDGVYRRDAVLETDAKCKYRLADIPLPGGVLRVDKVEVPAATDIRLGHYSLPELGAPIKYSTMSLGKGRKAHIVYNGEYSLAMIPLAGWASVFPAYPEGLHPVSHRCGVLMASDHILNKKVYITLQLWKKSNKPFTRKELSQVKSFTVSGNTVSVILADGTLKTVVFE